jgi:hypothetical protein
MRRVLWWFVIQKHIVHGARCPIDFLYTLSVSLSIYLSINRAILFHHRRFPLPLLSYGQHRFIYTVASRRYGMRGTSRPSTRPRPPRRPTRRSRPGPRPRPSTTWTSPTCASPYRSRRWRGGRGRWRLPRRPGTRTPASGRLACQGPPDCSPCHSMVLDSRDDNSND